MSGTTPPLTVVPLGPAHRDWANALLTENWGATQIISRGVLHDAAHLPGFVALRSDVPSGLATYHHTGTDCELVSLDSTTAGAGIGTALIGAVRAHAIATGCRRVWLITTNDNLAALRFYQRRGFVLVAVHRDAIAESRRLKPQIPLIGAHDIPIRDEIELESPL